MTAVFCIAAPWAASSAAAAPAAPFDDAVAVWHLSDLPTDLTLHGDVRAGVELRGEDRAASLSRGGDGRAAQFDGGYLDAGQGTGGKLNLTGRAFSMCVRVRDPSGQWMAPLFSKHGGHDKLVYNLFSHDLGQGKVIGFELGTDGTRGMTQVVVPLEMIGATQWHDVICRFDGIRLQMFVDGVMLDEGFPIGALRQGNAEPCLIGAESVGGAVKSGFRGMIDHAAIWSRALSDAEIEFLSGGAEEVRARRAEYIGELPSMQYYRPPNQWNVGDTLPFFHDGTFHFVYLLDRGHHTARGGLGAHQWAHATSRDLVHWTERPLLVPISRDDEGSICTGSLFFNGGVYYAFYATRGFDRHERLSLATSDDGIRFTKTDPNPFLVAGDKYMNGFRDPHVFRDEQTGLFHLLVSTMLKDGKRGCLAQYTSGDLKSWSEIEPFLIEGNEVPECPDYFQWNGWYYLLFSQRQVAHYRISKQPLGPWTRPKVDVIDGGAARVMKTAAFTLNRRIATASIWPHGYAGWAVFRELVQHEDGALGSRFVPEMIPPTAEPVALQLEAPSEGVSGDGQHVRIVSRDGGGRGRGGEATLVGLPANGRIRMRVDARASSVGLRLGGAELRIEPAQQRVSLSGGQPLAEIEGLDRPFTLDIIRAGNIFDLCIDERRTLVNWLPHAAGDRLVLSVGNGEANFSEITASPLR